MQPTIALENVAHISHRRPSPGANPRASSGIVNLFFHQLGAAMPPGKNGSPAPNLLVSRRSHPRARRKSGLVNSAIQQLLLFMATISAIVGCEPPPQPNQPVDLFSNYTTIEAELLPVGAGARVKGPNRCYTNDDCLLFSCDCVCKAVSNQQKTQCKPSCVNILDPCTDQTSVCEKHQCVLKPKKEIPAGSCTVEQDCSQSFELCFAPGQKLPCGICYNPDPSEVCNDDSMCKQIDPTWICAASQSLCTCSGETLCIEGCTTNSNCALGEVCSSTNHCVPKPCTTSAECPVDFICTNSNSGLGCLRKSCTSSSQCDGYCVNGYCYSSAGFCSPPPP